MIQDEALKELKDWLKRWEGKIDSKQVAAMLLFMGSSVAFQCAPSEEKAIGLIQDMISKSWQELHPPTTSPSEPA